MRVPDDIAVAGFGDYDIALICVPTQTTINPFPALIGEHTAELILSLRDGTTSQRPQIINITPCLVPGGSTVRLV